MAEWTGLEPATSGVTGQHSNQLNYHSAEPGIIQTGRNPCNYQRATIRMQILAYYLVGAEGFEPPTLSV